MPPITRPKRPSAPKGEPSPSQVRGSAEGRPRPESPIGKERPSAPPKPRGRPTNRDNLKDRLERFYMMVGTMLEPFGRFYSPLQPIGQNLKQLSTEATDAWMELADQDPKVKAYLESITGASTWGNVIGIHFAIFASAIPTGTVVNLFSSEQFSDPIAAARAAGMSEEDIAAAVAMGERMGGGPGDTIKSDRPVQEAPSPPSTRPGIVDPKDLGVTNPGIDHTVTMPANSGPLKGA